jgi:hypothetical protein
LYGDNSYNKDTLRKLMSNGSALLAGNSTVNFDEIAKEKVFAAINQANMQTKKDLIKDYKALKNKIGKSPMMLDFLDYGYRDPFLYVKKERSYFNFAKSMEMELQTSLNTTEQKLLELFGNEINNSKRLEESLILKSLLTVGSIPKDTFKHQVYDLYGYLPSDKTISSAISNLNFEFVRERKNKQLIPAKEVYNLDLVQNVNGIISISNSFQKHLSNTVFRQFLWDTTEYSIRTFDKLFDMSKWRNGFVLYRKYSRKDVFRILNTKENPVAQNVGGYMVSPDFSNCPIFVNYHKEEDISESTKYEDVFVNPREFDWMSKSNRKLESKDVQSILGNNGSIRLPLFIKKNNDEGTDFYYMGDMHPIHNHVEQTTMNNDKGKKVSVVKIRFELEDAVESSLYTYLGENVVV